ncbi:PQQ-dependent sugar dehydrogenase [Emticicia agri]|uniref:Sorbosone dehydrogenase n=1 Tax=Emticicia agri TaxID=2492393 RepID=A0A4Q5M5G7_9BACT|nr:PQQ-dependent sugar dehydrogenase [Emticicia agri]RYU97153.1 sorbosone dehydrogenase [Emticicia agri]
MKKIILPLSLAFGWFLLTSASVEKNVNDDPKNTKIRPDNDNGGIKLASGFGAVVVAEATGKARHIKVLPNGTIYIKNSNAKDEKGITVLKDTNSDGKADETEYFGNFGGTGIDIYNGYLYASSNSEVFRYKLDANGNVIDKKNPETVITGLPDLKQHESKPFTFDESGHIYVTIGAPSNVCQEKDRQKGSPGMMPCPLLEKNGGIWQFDADKLKQKQENGIRFATGIRNAVALDWDTNSKTLYALQHGRDMLFQHYPEMFSAEKGAELPAEEFLLIKKNDDFGWPYSYYDQDKKQMMLGPEYGGDGKKTYAKAKKPIMAFPGHWAPNDVLFYHGNQFPAKYKNGAFICFHGSWNRAPLNQAGYFVAFVPFKNGLPSGPYEVFAEDFAGGPEIKSPGDAKARPMGLAEGSDGTLYITDSVKGKVWRVMYNK